MKSALRQVGEPCSAVQQVNSRRRLLWFCCRAALALLQHAMQHVADNSTLAEAGVRLAVTGCSVLAELAVAHAASFNGHQKAAAAAAALQRHVQAAFARRKVQKQLLEFFVWLAGQQPAAAMQLRGALKDALAALAALYAYSMPVGSPGHGKQEFAVDFKELRDVETALKAVRRRLSAKVDANLASAYAALQARHRTPRMSVATSTSACHVCQALADRRSTQVCAAMPLT